jgi:16S rRNA (cytosine967-C5)-methyltransferase
LGTDLFSCSCPVDTMQVKKLQKSEKAQPRQEKPARVALWQQLQHVAHLVQAVSQGSSATATLEAVPAALRAGVQALGYQVLRRLGMARWLRAQLVPRSPRSDVDALLCCALALAWKQSAAGTRHASMACANDAQPDPAGGESAPYSEFTLVNQAVEAARRHPRMRHQAGLVNACLRRFLSERDTWQERCRQASPQHCPELLNLPLWWLARLQADHPHDALAIALAGQQQPSMHLRVNARRITPARYLQEHLLPAGLSGRLLGEHGILLEKPCPVQQLPGFAQGLVSVQDAAAQLAAPLLLRALQARKPQEGLRLLDACAAPGGKTAHLLELDNHDVTALDIDAARCERINDTLQRLGLQASRVYTADAAQPGTWWNGEPFDGILLDAPCSASGIVRRHPDIVWLRREQDVDRLAQTQRQLLDALWPLLDRGGVLLYCTCSVFRAEGEEQVAAFLLRHNDAVRLPAPGHLLPVQAPYGGVLGQNVPQSSPENPAQSDLSTQLPDHDGFFYTLLAKNA